MKMKKKTSKKSTKILSSVLAIGMVLNFVPSIHVKAKEQNYLYDVIAQQSVLDSQKSEFVSGETGINFSQVSSDTNGKGIYTLSSTKNNKYPIQYYRGNVNDNNILFANYCWQIVRTTETGGTKLVFNGTPVNGKCSDKTNTNIGTSQYNENTDQSHNEHYGEQIILSHAGYMYGEKYNAKNHSLAGTFVLGNDVEYKDGNYTLKQTSTTTNNWETDEAKVDNHHYTCFTNSETCKEVYYIYKTDATTANYITLTNGEKIDDVLEKLTTKNNNSNDSIIKTKIDEWYKNNMTKYTGYLEDTVWCNDRSINNKGYFDKDTSLKEKFSYGGYSRVSKPSLSCPNKNDSFTVNKSNGNGALTYPTALLTGDEIILAGTPHGTMNVNNYLSAGYYYWTMTPYNDTDLYFMVSNGYLSSAVPTGNFGIRPAISLKNNIVVVNGDGTTDNPYQIAIGKERINNEKKNTSTESKLKNPNTATFIGFGCILFIMSAITYIVLKKTKVKKF